MDKIIVVAVCALFLTVGRAWAQDANTAADNAPANEVRMQVPPDNDNMENEALNDEGYGTDDEEYYGSENEMANTQDNAEEALPAANAEEPTPANVDGPATDNAVTP